MIVQEFIDVALNSVMIVYLGSIGYDVESYKRKDKQGRMAVPMGTKMTVKVSDLPKSSNQKVLVKCEYCDREPYFKTICDYYRKLETSPIKKNCCIVCRPKKIKESNILVYGVENTCSLPEFRQKVEKTMIEKYGVKNALQLPTFREKAEKTMMDRYGVTSPAQSLIIKEKTKQTNMVKYGVEFVSQLDSFKQKLRIDRRIPYEQIKQKFSDENFTLLMVEDDYINSSQAMECFCNQHPETIQYKKYNHLKDGFGCRFCFYENNSGENNGSWQGGVTPINHHIRDKLHDWKRGSMRNCGYKCVITGEEFDAIHHLYGFDLILDEAIDICNFDFDTYQYNISDVPSDKLKELEQVCVDLHAKYPLGVCLAKSIHKLFHINYNYGKNTPEQFEEFKQRYFNGEFDSDLSENSTKKTAV